MLSRLRGIFLQISLLALAAGGGWWAGQHEIALEWQNAKPEVTVVRKAVPPSHQQVDFSLFWEVWDRLQQNYLDPSVVKPEKMVYGAIAGMTAALGDPYTVFLPPQQQQEAKSDLAGEFTGVGIQLGYKKEHLAVIAPLDGSPAKEAGIQPGDWITHIKDEKKGVDVTTDGMTLPDAVDKIRGEAGTEVTLTIVRETTENAQGLTKPQEYKMKRNTIQVKSVTLEFADAKDILGSEAADAQRSSQVAIVRLSRFGDKTVSEWDDAVDSIVKSANFNASHFSGMVLDLRNNPGGYLDDAVKISSEFFKDGTVVEQKGRTLSHSYTVEKPGKLLDLPLVVLVNQGSASASEIVAGALQARTRAKLVGEHSFGKGTVQDAQDLPGGAGLHVTTARWLLPNGNWIHEEGLKPDVEVQYDQDASKDQKWDNQMKKAVEVLRNEEK